MLGAAFLILAAFVTFLEDASFVRQFYLTLLLFMPIVLVLFVLYPPLFQKPVKANVLAYFPPSFSSLRRDSHIC